MSKIDEIKKQLEAATPGPWAVHDFNGSLVVERCGASITAKTPSCDNRTIARTTGILDLKVERANAGFIASAPENIRWLITELEKTQQHIKDLQSELQDWGEDAQG